MSILKHTCRSKQKILWNLIKSYNKCLTYTRVFKNKKKSFLTTQAVATMSQPTLHVYIHL